MALGAKMDGKDFHVWVVTSDAEHQCGLHWEAVMTAAKFKLDNLTAYRRSQLHSNRRQHRRRDAARTVRARSTARSTGKSSSATATTWPISSKRRSALAPCDGKPQVIVANTIPGKGVSYMEGDYTWHGKPPNTQQADEALRELSARTRTDPGSCVAATGVRDAAAAAMHLADYRSRRPQAGSDPQRLRRRIDRSRHAQSRRPRHLRGSLGVDALRRFQEGAPRRSTSRSASPSRCSLRWPAASRRSARFRGSRAMRCSIRDARGSKCARSWRSMKPT